MRRLCSHRLDHSLGKSQDQSQCVLRHRAVEHTPNVGEPNITDHKFREQHRINAGTAPLNPAKLLCQVPGLLEVFCSEIPTQKYFCFRQELLQGV